MKSEEIEKMYKLEKSHWWFSAKRQLIIQLFKKYGKNGRWLDIGCGTGLNLKEFQKHSEAFGCDISEECISFCKKRGLKNLTRCSVTELKFSNNEFDVVTALDLLEHIENDVLAIKEVHRVLKKGGIFIVTVPAYKFLWTKHDKIFYHKRRYSKKELTKKIRNIGFKTRKISYWNFMMFPFITLYKLSNRKSNIQRAPVMINFLLRKIILLDNFLIRYFNLPFGVSLTGVFEKKI